VVSLIEAKQTLRETRAILKMRSWRKLLVRIKSVVGRVVGSLLGQLVGFGLGQKSILDFKGLRLVQFVPKPKSKEKMKSYAVTGPGLVLDPEVGFEFAKGVQRPETMSAVVQIGFACLAVESRSLSTGPGQVGTAGASHSALVQDADQELESSSQSALLEMVPSQVEVPQAWKASSGSAFSGDSSGAPMLGVRLNISLPVMSEAGGALYPPESKPVLRYSRKLKDAKLIDLIAESVAVTTVSPSSLVEAVASPVVSTSGSGWVYFLFGPICGCEVVGF
jgi:hypothetical protein